jgi:hypothetical protein
MIRPSMHAWLEALQNSAFSAWVVGSDSIWAYPMILTMHTVGLGVVVGSAAVVDLRLLGVGPNIPLAPLRRLFPAMWIGAMVATVTGTARALAALSVVLWIAAIAMGRIMAYAV